MVSEGGGASSNSMSGCLGGCEDPGALGVTVRMGRGSSPGVLFLLAMLGLTWFKKASYLGVTVSMGARVCASHAL